MFLDPATFPWTRRLEERAAAIRDEFEALEGRRLVPWPEAGIYNRGWDVLGFYAMGRRLAENCASCPETASALDAIPGLTTAGFSVLSPGAIIKPHRGYTPTVVRCHLGIIVPGYCGLRVGEEVRLWEEGRCLVFDDTLEHEAWNLSEDPRVVLLLDVVRPGATFEADFPGRRALLDYFDAR